MKELTRTIIKYLRALYGRDFPRDGIKSHHGVSVKCGTDRVGFTDYEGQDLLITVYADSLHVAYSRSRHMKVKRAVEKAVQQLRRRSSVSTFWNGAEGNNGISIVIPGALPDSLRTAIGNYRQLDNVFKRTPYINAQFESFNTWLDNRLHRRRKK